MHFENSKPRLLLLILMYLCNLMSLQNFNFGLQIFETPTWAAKCSWKNWTGLKKLSRNRMEVRRVLWKLWARVSVPSGPTNEQCLLQPRWYLAKTRNRVISSHAKLRPIIHVFAHIWNRSNRTKLDHWGKGPSWCVYMNFMWKVNGNIIFYCKFYVSYM